MIKAPNFTKVLKTSFLLLLVSLFLSGIITTYGVLITSLVRLF